MLNCWPVVTEEDNMFDHVGMVMSGYEFIQREEVELKKVEEKQSKVVTAHHSFPCPRWLARTAMTVSNSGYVWFE